MFRDSQSAATLNSLGSYSAVVVIPHSKDFPKFPWPLPFSDFEYPPFSSNMLKPQLKDVFL